MPTFTTNYALEKPLVNNAVDADQWGGQLNSDMDSLDTLMRAGITTAVQSVQTATFTPTISISVKNLYPCDATTGGFSLSLPLASAAANGATVFFKKADSSANAVTINVAGSDKIDGATSVSLTAQYQLIGLISDGVSNWELTTIAVNVFTGDTGTGGTAGIVPAPAAGDAVAKKTLNANGTWETQYVQVQESVYTAAAQLSATIPLDDTIPQITEGTEILTVAFTPASATSNIVVEWQVVASILAGGDQPIAALFQDTTANALAATIGALTNNGFVQTFTGSYQGTSASTTLRTYRLRIGGGVGNIFPNSINPSGRIFGGISACRLRVYEVAQ